MTCLHLILYVSVETLLNWGLHASAQDALTICAGKLPGWCGMLVRSAKFLFPFDIRWHFFYSTVFGLARALHNLHDAKAAEGGGGPSQDGHSLRPHVLCDKVNPV
jgi:hypothetical protein